MRDFVRFPNKRQKLLDPVFSLIPGGLETIMPADRTLPPNHPLVDQALGAVETELHGVVVIHRELLLEFPLFVIDHIEMPL